MSPGSAGARLPVWRLPYAWFILFAVALILRLGAAFLLNGLRNPEIFEYDDLARSVLAGTGFVYHHLGVNYHSYAPPLYSWICAALYMVGLSTTSVLVVQMIVGAGHAVVTGLLAERLGGSRFAGLAAGVLVAVHPGLVVYASAKLHPLPFDALFFTLVLWQCWKLAEHPTWMRALATGLVAGVGALSRATIVVFLPMAAVWAMWAAGHTQWRRVAARWMVAGLCAGAVILPWAWRNTTVNGEFVWMVSVDSEVLWRGNNEFATGHSYLGPNRIILDTLTTAERKELYRLPNEMAQSRWFHERAWSFITADPIRFVKLTVSKFFYFWWFGPQTGVLYPPNWLVAYKVYYVPVLVLGVIGVMTIVRSGRSRARAELVLLVLFLLALSSLQSLYYVEARHRWAIEPLVLIVAGAGGDWLFRRFQSARVPS